MYAVVNLRNMLINVFKHKLIQRQNHYDKCVVEVKAVAVKVFK